MSKWSSCVAVAVAIGCGPSAAVAPVAAPEHASPPRSEPPAPPASVIPAASASPAPQLPPSPQLPPFPPPSFQPPIERTAKPGDGVWTTLVEGAPGAPPLLVKSTAHPDTIKPHVYVALVAIDLSRVAIRLVAGTREPITKAVPEDHRTGLVAAGDLPGLVAVMNGGFMTRHGGWGMAIGQDVFLPPREDGCTVALFKDGSVETRTHPAIAPRIAEVMAYRQTPPCLVEQGQIHEALLGDEKPRRWGMSETGGVDIRRSALGVAAGGRTLIYGLGEWVTPRQMAEAMRAAGAVDAAQLDVNWSYTRFLLYGKAASGGAPEVTATLVPKTKHAPKQYVEKPSERDFFYLVKKDR